MIFFNITAKVLMDFVQRTTGEKTLVGIRDERGSEMLQTLPMLRMPRQGTYPASVWQQLCQQAGYGTGCGLRCMVAIRDANSAGQRSPACLEPRRWLQGRFQVPETGLEQL